MANQTLDIVGNAQESYGTTGSVEEGNNVVSRLLRMRKQVPVDL